MSKNISNYENENTKDYLYKQLDDIRARSTKQNGCLWIIILQTFIVIGLLVYIAFFHKCQCTCYCTYRDNSINSGVPSEPPTETESSEDDTTKDSNSKDEVNIPIYPTIWNVSKESTIKLSNPLENTVLLEYTLSDENNEIFYISPRIKAGEEIEVVIGDKLKSGSHNCLMTIKSYDTEKGPANSATSNSSITIRIS